MAYRPYRGNQHKGLRRFLTVLVIVLILLIAAAAFVFLGPNPIVYTPDGIRFPSRPSGGAVSPSPAAAVSSPALEVVTPASASGSPQPEQTPQVKTLRALFVPAGALADSSAVDEYIHFAEKTEINALVLDMKPDSGLLSFPNTIGDAGIAGATAETAQQAAGAVKRFQDAGIYLIARISCFKDNLVPRRVQAASFKVNSGVIWLDRYNETWLNPYSSRACAYLADVAEAVGGLGFDEVMLDNLNFPVLGKLSYIHYGSSDNNGDGRPDALKNAVREISARLGEKTRLSAVALPDTVISGADKTAGQDLSLFNDFYRVYVYVPQNDAKESFDAIYGGAEKNLGGRLPDRFVSIVAAPEDADGAGERMKTAVGVSGGDRGLGFVAFSETGQYPENGF